MKKIKIVVLMSIYQNDKKKWVCDSINSILNQSESNFHLLLSIDGYINEELKKEINSFKENPKITIFIYNEKKGLATRLNQMIDFSISNFEFDYFARMDADDICTLDRLEIQYNFLSKNKNIDIIGSSVIEMDQNEKPLNVKKMEPSHEILKKNIIRKCPLNHPTVMMKREIFLNNHRYDQNLMNTQDYMLWVNLMANGYKFSNIEKPLLYFRISNNFYSKRGLNKAVNDFTIRMTAMKKLQCFSLKNFLFTNLIFIIRISPKFIKKIAYKWGRK